MPQPRKYATRAEQAKAYRARKAAKAKAATPGPEQPATQPTQPTRDTPASITPTVMVQPQAVMIEGQTAAAMGLPSAPPSPVRVRDPKTGRFPPAPRPDPCTPEQWDTWKNRMLDGDAPADICRAAGLPWAAFESYAARFDADGVWEYAQEQNRAQVVARLQARAMAAVEGRVPSHRRRSVNASGEESTSEDHTIDASLIERSAALRDPATHGRQAGRQDNGPGSLTVIVTLLAAVVAPARGV